MNDQMRAYFLTITRNITATEFKAECLDLMDRIGTPELDSVVITKRGKPVAVLSAPQSESDSVRSLHGFMRGSVVLSAGLDLTQPVFDEPFIAETGALHG